MTLQTFSIQDVMDGNIPGVSNNNEHAIKVVEYMQTTLQAGEATLLTHLISESGVEFDKAKRQSVVAAITRHINSIDGFSVKSINRKKIVSHEAAVKKTSKKAAVRATVAAE